MSSRTEAGHGAIEVRAFDSVPALARMGNVSANRLRRLLRANRVVFLRAGRAEFVPLSEIQRRIPPLWDCLCLGMRIRPRQK